MGIFIGLMSGTSLDGIDGVLADTDTGVQAPGGLLASRKHVHLPMPEALRAELWSLNRSGADELHRAALATNALMACYAAVVTHLLDGTGLTPHDITAIGAHGQTVRHRPRDFDGIGYTLQLMNGALLAERSGIDVVCDFRTRDVAAGGQGAPLAPGFHAARFGRADSDVAVLNLGGIANLTLLASDGSPTLGFDCGPASVLLDIWCQRHRGLAFDAEGAWAAGGKVQGPLLAQMLAEPFFQLEPPKSTGRDLFDAAWLDGHLDVASNMQPQDVMATLAELTARGVVDALRRHAPHASRLVVCGGGAFNRHLLARIAALGGIAVTSSADEGLPPDQVEALAFAWLASAFVTRRAGNLPSVTGARGARVLGALYPA